MSPAQLHVFDGEDYSQVAVHTSQDMKYSCCRKTDTEQKDSCQGQCLISVEVAQSKQDGSKNVDDLKDGHVVGEEVGVAHCLPGSGRALPPPSADTRGQDEDVEREEDHVDQGVGGVGSDAAH